ncbi:hypothetical protein ACI65C_008975 [Semiaphis heraclei]
MIHEVLSKNTSELNKQPNQTLLSDSIKRELTKKRRLRRAWQNTRNPEAKHRFNNQTSKVKRLLQHHRESAWSSFLAELKPGDTKIFKINKSLINRTPPNRPLNSHLGPVFDSPGKSELFATNLATQFNCPDGNQATNQLVANSMRTLTTLIKSPIQSVSPGEIHPPTEYRPTIGPPETNRKRPAATSSFQFKKIIEKLEKLCHTVSVVQLSSTQQSANQNPSQRAYLSHATRSLPAERTPLT